MATVEGLTRRLSRIQMKIEPVENYLDTGEWLAILDVMRSVLPAYPDALEVAEETVARMGASMEREQVHIALYQAIGPFMDARVAVAAALVHLNDLHRASRAI